MKTPSILTAIGLGISLLAAGALGAADAPEKSAQSPGEVPTEKLSGKAGDSQNVSRTVYVDIGGTIYFNPAKLTIRRGETVRFVITNSGKELHEMVIGTTQELDEHAGLMASFPGMVEHAGAFMTYVAPGKTEEIVWQFTENGEFNFGCVIPRHSRAVEVGKIFVVSPKLSTQYLGVASASPVKNRY